MKHYTLKDFQNEYPNNDACLDKIFKLSYGDNQICKKCNNSVKYYRIKTRKCYKCPICNNQLYPMANTIFEKSTTPLTYWFYAIFLFTKSKNGLSASELQRQIGVTYKTAFRMLHKIRSLLIQENEKFTGIVEMDEAYVGGKNKNRHFDKKIKHTQGRSHMDKKTLFGIMERGGNVIVRDIPNTSSKHLLPIIYKNVLQNPETIIMTDEWTPYKKLDKNYKHEKVYHGKGQYSNGLCHTNSMENFWSVLKRTINGSYVGVSKKYMQVYADEVVFRYNNRNNRDIFNSVLEKI